MPYEPDESNAPLMPRVLGLVLGGLMILSISVLSVIFWIIQPAKDTIPFEIAKSLLQLGVVATAAAAISILAFEYQREREKIDRNQENDRQEQKKERGRELEDQKAQQDADRRKIEYRDDLLKSIMSRAVASYNTVKKARRILEAKGKYLARGVSFGEGEAKVEERVDGTIYDHCIEVIIDSQLEFETLKRDVETTTKTLKEHAFVAQKLRDMELYLNGIIGEFKSMRREFHSVDQTIALSRLPVLKAFLIDSEVGSFPLFSSPLREIQRQIREELLHPNLPDLSRPAYPPTADHPVAETAHPEAGAIFPQKSD